MPNGNYIGWKAIAVGNNNQMAQDALKKEYKSDMSYQEGLKLCAKVLSQAMDTQKPSSEKMEFSVVRRVDGVVEHVTLSSEETDALLNTVQAEGASKGDE